MTQQQLADAADLNVKTVTNIEAGHGFHKSTGRLLAMALKLVKVDAKRLAAG